MAVMEFNLPISQDDFMDANQCKMEPNGLLQPQWISSWTILFFSSVMMMALMYFVYKVYGEFSSFEPRMRRMRDELAEAQVDIRNLKVAWDELRGENELLSESLVNLQFGLVALGGYANFQRLSPNQRQIMYSTERGNFVASSSRQRQTPTDPDPTVEPETSTAHFTQVMETFRSELYEALLRGSTADVTNLQQMMMTMLELVGAHQPVPQHLKTDIFLNMADRMQSMADRQTIQSVGSKYREYSNLLRETAYW